MPHSRDGESYRALEMGPPLSDTKRKQLETRRGRVCKGEDCTTVLSIYNPREFCAPCERKETLLQDQIALKYKD